ncbi:hypothetical protein ABEU20_002494 [Rhodococcus sp. PAM 2766]|uniref:ScoMcrA-like N-terminal head domain-containing protein n=1 Tax=Rhodococcus parequi TaxID=3137122 RepID=A0ABW9FEG3_9NOCA
MSSKIDLSAVSRESVLDAVAEFDSLGQEEFLRRRGFKAAKNYRLVHGGRFYDSKAIVGVAHGYATGDFVDSTGFSGGLATVAGCLSELGFVVDHGAKNASGGLLWELETNTPVFTGNGKAPLTSTSSCFGRWCERGVHPIRCRSRPFGRNWLTT